VSTLNGVNERVKKLRLFLEMNQSDFGKKIGVAQTYLSQIEKGDRPVTDKIFKIICLESWNGKFVNEDWLTDGIGEMFVKSKDEQISEMLGEIQRNGKDSFKRRLVAALAKLNESDWEVLEKLVDSIGKE
jgi:transcriptional regulator with XRE-family HTH domain